MKNLQPNFAGGILSDGMLARGDLVKYQVGVRDALNVFVRQQGGLANRAGAMLAAGVDVTNGGSSPAPTIIPFQFSADEAYMLEFYNGVFRVLLDGAYVLDPAALNRDVTGLATTYDPMWTVSPSGYGVGDVAYLSAPSGNWLNGQVVRVTEVAGGLKLTMSNGLPISQVDGAPDLTGVKLSRVFHGAHPYLAVDMREVRFAQDADYLYMTHQNYPPYRLRRLGHANWTGEELPFGPSIGAPFSAVYTKTITAAANSADPIFTVPGHGLTVGEGAVIRGVSAPWPGTRALVVSHVLNANQVRLRTLDNRTLNSTSWGAIGGAATLESNTGGWELSGDPGATDNAVTERYKVAAMTASGEEGPASTPIGVYIDLTFKGNRGVAIWRPQAGAARYVIYRESGGVYGYIGSTTSTYFVDNNIAPDTSQGPVVTRIPFVGPGNYPAVVAFHEQRLFMGGTKNDPQLVEASQTSNPMNFGVSAPPRDSDAITFRIKHKQINAVRALVSSVALMAMTSGGEWALSGGGEEGRPLTPNNLFLRPVSYWGSATVEPATIGDVILMLQRGGKIARDYRMGGERPTDLTIMASDLMRQATVTGWAYCQTPHSILWVTLSDGGLLSMTYNAEHDIWGWTRHKIGGTNGLVLQVASILEGAEDVLYMVVHRTIGERRIIQTERMSTRMDSDPTTGIYLDAARIITYANPTNTARGFVHLAGETVSALVDGNVFHGLTVGLQGQVSIGDRTGTKWIVGHPYMASIETLPFETEVQGMGSTVGAKRRAPSASVLVERTRGVWAGDHPNRMVQVKEGIEEFSQGLPLRTTVHNVDILGDWATRPSVIIQQRDPLPFTVLGVAPEWQIGG